VHGGQESYKGVKVCLTWEWFYHFKLAWSQSIPSARRLVSEINQSAMLDAGVMRCRPVQRLCCWCEQETLTFCIWRWLFPNKTSDTAVLPQLAKRYLSRYSTNLRSLFFYLLSAYELLIWTCMHPLSKRSAASVALLHWVKLYFVYTHLCLIWLSPWRLSYTVLSPIELRVTHVAQWQGISARYSYGLYILL